MKSWQRREGWSLRRVDGSGRAPSVQFERNGLNFVGFMPALSVFLTYFIKCSTIYVKLFIF